MAKDTNELPPDSLHAPLCQSELSGHEAAERALLDAWSSGRLHHAWLIGGPAGVGKATLACRFARFLLARGTRDAAAAEQGPSLFGDPAPGAAPTSLYVSPDEPVFHRIAVRGHADLFTVTLGYDAKRNRERKVIVVDDVRDIRNFISLTPAENGYRVVLIDGAEDMNKSAANALLKMLEEPPPRTVFLLVSHAPGRLLPTIRSRCRTLTLRPLDDDTLAALLTRHKPDLAPGDRAALLGIADGSIGRALRLADEGGVALYREMVGLLGRLPDLDIGAAHAFGDKLARAQCRGELRSVHRIAALVARAHGAQRRRRNGARPKSCPARRTSCAGSPPPVALINGWRYGKRSPTCSPAPPPSISTASRPCCRRC